MIVALHLILLVLSVGEYNCNYELRLKIVTLADGGSDGYWRFIRSARVNKLDVEVVDVQDITWGDGYFHNKIDILRISLEKYKEDSNLILLFTDAQDAIMQSDETEILEKFKRCDANILISAEDVYPHRSIRAKYTNVPTYGYKYLSSAGIMGYAPALYQMLTLTDNYSESDHLYFTHIYFTSRERYNIKLDHTAELFQTLNGNIDHVETKFMGSEVKVINTRYKTTPSLINGNGDEPIKLYLNHLGNYIPRRWTHDNGCLSCKEDNINLQQINKNKWPTILIGLFILSPTPFINSFLHQISNLEYPKEKIHVFLFNMAKHHHGDVETWANEFKGEYSSLRYVGANMFIEEEEARNLGIQHCRKVKCDYYFSVDGSISLLNRRTLQILIQQNRTILTPVMSKQRQYWSNFWGDINALGYYKRSPDYFEIVKNYRQGVWNSPYITVAYLLAFSVIDKIGIEPFSSTAEHDDIDVKFCANLREKGIFMYVTNMEHFGHLKVLRHYKTNHKHNDLYELFDNQLDWEEQYLHPEYAKYLNRNTAVQEPCPDVYWVPIATKNFTNHLIEECENFGGWSNGKNEDKRIQGGYEGVPTVDIHMNQIGFEEHWWYMLQLYFAPMALRIFNYASKNESTMNFVVKYTPAGQYYLRPHHDASTYTINMALNEREVEYRGGGARFIRHNCSVPDTKVGWALLHPGRLTHFHEGLETTNGTRYIMISFVDP